MKYGDAEVFNEIIDRYIPEFKNSYYTGREKYFDKVKGKIWIYGGGSWKKDY